MKSSIFWDIVLCSLLKVNWCFGGTCCFQQQNIAVCFMLVSCLSYSSTLKVEAICFSKMSGDFQQNASHYTPQDRTLQTNKTGHILQCLVLLMQQIFRHQQLVPFPLRYVHSMDIQFYKFHTRLIHCLWWKMSLNCINIYLHILVSCTM
jgi:hypothetical protein